MTSSARVGVLSVIAVAVATALLALGFTTGLLFAQTTQPPPPVSGSAFTHDQMHEMMDAIHGEGASDRIHEAMGEDGEAMMEQCAAMMNMMMNMQGMMGGMMGGPNGTSMSDMMKRMMGR